MPFIPVQVTGTYKEWGELVLSWAMGTANPPGEKRSDDSVTIFTFPDDAQTKQIGDAGAGVVFPPSVKEVVFVRDTATRRYVRLPDPDMAKAAQEALKAGDMYGLPRFYSDPPLKCQLPQTPAQTLVLQAERVGDYSIGSCM